MPHTAIDRKITAPPETMPISMMRGEKRKSGQ